MTGTNNSEGGVMAEKWIVEWGSNTYWICDGSQLNEFQEHPEIGMAHEEKHARLFASSPLMLEALETLRAVIGQSVLTPILTDKAAVQKAVHQANAAIAAAKGE